ncbi:MAG: DUF1275 domain-containing protein [Bdellovibrionales bacterium]|nr:DUF1275 domain-containing protein [Bdellovibrionales bacterium]
MIFGNETISTYTRSNISIWMVLAFQAGLLNMGGFMACHSFVSHVTGYATLFGQEVNRAEFKFALGMLLVPLFFLAGAMLSGVLVDLQIKLQKKPRYYIVFGVLFSLLLFVVVGGFNGLFGHFGEPLEQSRDYTLLALLCLICGIQNGTVSLVSRSMVRTTHLTGITTDLGIGLVRVFNRDLLHGKIDDEWKANFMRIGIIGFFALGSISGFAAFRDLGFRGFLFPCAISFTLFALTVYHQLIKPRMA